MSIKYHDNNGAKKHELDERGNYADNWNPAEDYADNEYCRVYFRIDCASYEHNDRGYNGMYGFDSAADREAFYDGVAAALSPMGWNAYTFKDGHHGTDLTRGKENLYAHPQNISGEVKKRDVGRIAEALDAVDGLAVRWVDVYETVYDMDADEYAAYLAEQRGGIRSWLIENAATKRRDLFKARNSVTQSAAERFRLPRLGKHDGLYHPRSGQTYAFVCEVMAGLVREGWLVEGNGKSDMPLIRTANKAEQKARGLKAA